MKIYLKHRNKQHSIVQSGGGEEQGRRDDCEARPEHGHGPGEDVS